MVYSNVQSEQDKNNKKTKGTNSTMSNMKTIKLVERPANAALEVLSDNQLVQISELTLEHF